MNCTTCGAEFKRHRPSGKCAKCYRRNWDREARKDPVLGDKIRQRAKDVYQRHHARMLAERKELRERKHFSSKRQTVLQANNWTCQRCGVHYDDESKLTVHHEDGNGRGSVEPNNDDGNLTLLCRACHCKEHHADLMASKAHLYGRWSKDSDCCRQCGTTEVKHGGRGLCHNCYVKELRSTPGYKENRSTRKWASAHDACVSCGKAESPHRGHGKCRKCYINEYNKTYRRKVKI